MSGSLPAEPYYPADLVGDPILFDVYVIRDLLLRVAKAAVGLVQICVFWLVLIQVDIAIFVANLFLPRRHSTYAPFTAAAPSHVANSRIRRIRQLSRQRHYVAGTGNEVVPPSFSPLNPLPLWHAPIAFLACQLAFFAGTKDGHTPEWLRWWSTWCGIGFRGEWGHPDWPAEDDCRSPCPILNAMANHGILPADGRDISPHQLAAALSRTLNLSPTLAMAMTWSGEPLWRHRGHFDLSDLNSHNVVEHDASLLRPDVNSLESLHDVSAQSHSWPSLVDALLPTRESEAARAVATEGDSYQGWEQEPLPAEPYNGSTISLANLSQAMGARRLQCSRTNGQFSLSLTQKLYGSLKLVLLHRLSRGSVPDLRKLVGGLSQGATGKGGRIERYFSGLEHFPLAWQPNSQSCFGMTLIEALGRAVILELAVADTEVARNVTEMGQAGWQQPSEIGMREEVLGGPGFVGLAEADKEGQRLSPLLLTPEDEFAPPGSEDTLQGVPIGTETSTGEPKVKTVTFDTKVPRTERVFDGGEGGLPGSRA